MIRCIAQSKKQGAQPPEHSGEASSTRREWLSMFFFCSMFSNMSRENKMRFVGAMALAALVAPAEARAQPSDWAVVSALTGGMIAQECAKNRGLQFDGCTGYILGVADTLQFDRKTCRPQSDAATLQTVTIVRRYIDGHPEKWGWHPSWIVREALVAAYPCKRRPHKKIP